MEIGDIIYVYRKGREGNVFTGVCHFVHNRPHGYSVSAHLWYSAVGTYPSGMISGVDSKFTCMVIGSPVLGIVLRQQRIFCHRKIAHDLMLIQEICNLFSVLKALQCPCLTRLPVTQVKSCAPQLLRMADRCPIIGHVMRYSSAISGHGDQGQ